MSKLKNFDLHHWAIVFTFFVGLGILVVGMFQGLPAGITPMQAILLLAPAFIAIPNTIQAFFKNPPATPEQALAEGEHAAGGAGAKAGSRGMVAMRALLMLSVVGLALFLMLGANARRTVAVQGQGCAWWTKNAPVVEQYGQKDVMCVFGSIMGGAASYQAVASSCANLSVEQIAQIAVSLFDYYALQQTDAGLSGAAMPPAIGLPASLTASQFASLRSVCGR